MKKFFRFLICIIMSTMLISCSEGASNSNSSVSSSTFFPSNENISSNDVEEIDPEDINDAFTKITIDSIFNQPIKVVGIDPQEIINHSIHIEKIQNLEIEISTINDEMIYLVYQNFQNYFGENIDYEKLFKDLAITAGCIIVMVTLSTVGGPIGTYFGAVLTSEFSAAGVLIGAAIDATIAGIQAYKEGGDLEYILGHMINGVVDGMKFGAIFAPLTGIASGIKAVKAVKHLTKLPGCEKLTYKAASNIMKSFDDVVKATKGIAKNASDSAISTAFKQASKTLPKEITEDVFKTLFKQQDNIINMIIKSDPFNVKNKLIKTLKDNFLEGLEGTTKKTINSVINSIQRKTINSLDDILDKNIRDYFSDNLLKFTELFGDKFSREFVDSILSKRFTSEMMDGLRSIASSNAYGKIVSKISKTAFDEALDDPATILLMQIKYGAKNVNKLFASKTLFDQLLKKHEIDFQTINKVIDGLVDGTIKNLDDIYKINGQIARNMSSSREIIASIFQSMGLSKKLSGLIDDLSVDFLKNAKRVGETVDNLFSNEARNAFSDVVRNKLTKSEIINKFGESVYKEFVDNSNITISALSICNDLNKNLAKEIFSDNLISKNLAPEVIDNILKGKSIKMWGLSDKQIFDIYSDVATYYNKFVGSKTTENFIGEIASIRGQCAADLAKAKGIALRNSKYAGQVCPPLDNYIAEKYGNIYYSSAGFPIFDKYAVARVVSKQLTGDSASDIRMANLIHHGTTLTPPGFTWHHLEDGKSLILIPTELHEAYRHTGGATLLLEGLKEFIDTWLK